MADNCPTVHVPPFETSDLLGAGGEIGSEPEDFVVDELPLYPPLGEGAHWYVRVRKRCLSTPQMIRAVARAAGVPPAAVGSAGMKDKHAVTTQWLSAPVDGCAPPPAWKLPEGLEVLEVTRHRNKLRTGHLRANDFAIRLVGVDAASRDRARAIGDRLTQTGLVNYFGAQRFGRGGANLARALAWANASSLGRRARADAKFHSSVIQAEIFNRFATARTTESSELLAGDVVRLGYSNAIFVVDDPDKELPRLRAGEITLTGPIVGPKMKPAGGRPRELEQRAIDSLDLSEEPWRRIGRSAPGTRRDLRIWPETLRVEAADPASLIVRFRLPAGGYATQLLRELTRAAFLARAG